MILSKNHQYLVDKLIYLTNADRIKWIKYNTPTSFIYKSDGNSFVVDVFNSTIDKNEEKCVELAIMKDGKIYEDLVYCNITEFKDDYTLLNNLYSAVKAKNTQRDDIDVICESLPS